MRVDGRNCRRGVECLCRKDAAVWSREKMKATGPGGQSTGGASLQVSARQAVYQRHPRRWVRTRCNVRETTRSV